MVGWFGVRWCGWGGRGGSKQRELLYMMSSHVKCGLCELYYIVFHNHFIIFDNIYMIFYYVRQFFYFILLYFICFYYVWYHIYYILLYLEIDISFIMLIFIWLFHYISQYSTIFHNICTIFSNCVMMYYYISQ